MKKEDVLSNDFLKQFKNGEELSAFLGQLQKRGVEAILEGELDNHLGFEKHGDAPEGNFRNGHLRKKVRNQYGEIEIQVPRDRNSTFEPVLVPKRKNIVDGIENIIISLYAKGMSVSNIEEQIKDLYNFEIFQSFNTYLCPVENQKKDIRKLSLAELEEFFVAQGEKKFRAKQVYEWLWNKSLKNFDDMSNISLSSIFHWKCNNVIIHEIDNVEPRFCNFMDETDEFNDMEKI